jgi:diguanylate cyclase (GGDEF)-like protein
MADIDHFKSVNDRYGHAVGDKVIRFLANIITEHSRPSDLVGRFGGEEFCIVLPGIGSKIAAEIAERLRLLVEKGHGVNFSSGMRITTSFGVSSVARGVHDLHVLLEQADKSLYAAKRSGRNCVVRWTRDLQEEVVEGESIPENDERAWKAADNGDAEPEKTNDEGFDEALVSVDELHGTDEGKLAAHIQDRDYDNVQDANLDLEESTSMPNRILILDRIGQSIKRAQRDNNRVVVMFIGVDTRQSVSDALSR